MLALASYQVAGLVGAGSVVLLLFLWVTVGVLVGWCLERRREWRSRADWGYARDLAEFSIRQTKRQAIQDMLAAEREYRDLGGGEVIEGTAVEVRR